MIAWIVISGMLASALLLAGRGMVTGTTMLAPWVWGQISIVTISLVEVVLICYGQQDSLVAQPYRFAAAATTFCPMVGVLGARRPQNHAWQLVVVSLWLILSMPALQSMAFHQGTELSIRDARGLLLWVLIIMGVMNLLPTRHAACALLCGAAQITLLGAHLPVLRHSFGPASTAMALTLIAAAIGLLMAQRRVARKPIIPEDRLWLEFRDVFGALWALRVQQRINETASQRQWQVALGWHGFRGRATQQETPRQIGENQAEIQQALRTTLRRFASTQWIDRYIRR